MLIINNQQVHINIDSIYEVTSPVLHSYSSVCSCPIVIIIKMAIVMSMHNVPDIMYP